MALDAVAGREERVEALNQRRVVAEEGRDAVDDTGGVDATPTYPQNSGQSLPSFLLRDKRDGDKRLSLEVLHDSAEWSKVGWRGATRSISGQHTFRTRLAR